MGRHKVGPAVSPASHQFLLLSSCQQNQPPGTHQVSPLASTSQKPPASSVRVSQRDPEAWSHPASWWDRLRGAALTSSRLAQPG